MIHLMFNFTCAITFFERRVYKKIYLVPIINEKKDNVEKSIHKSPMFYATFEICEGGNIRKLCSIQN